MARVMFGFTIGERFLVLVCCHTPLGSFERDDADEELPAPGVGAEGADTTQVNSL